jgi:O-antigen/teichoic acid export membrane protein
VAREAMAAIEEQAGVRKDSTTPSADRFVAIKGRGLRRHAARGTLVNSAFQVGFAGLSLVRRLVVAAYLTRAEFGIWSIVLTTVLTVSWLKQVGVADKYVQQDEPDQEAAYQKAFTMELAASSAFFVVMAVALPLYGVAYGTSQIVLPGLVLALSVPLSAFESGIWVSYRRMQYVRQRTLGAVDPLVSLAVTVLLAVLGAGYWALVLGVLAGTVAGGLVVTATCPYRPRLRWDRGTAREYASFSWPLLGLGLSSLVVVQGMMLASNRAVGLAGLGAIGLAASITTFTTNIDSIISQALYPAVCAVAGQRDKLFEAFVKSNRLALVWAMPFGVGLGLFASDLVHFVLGPRWAPAAGLLAAMGVISALSQIGYNHSIFFRAVNDTRPLFKLSVLSVVTFLVVGVPLILAFGLTGYALAWGAMTLLQIAGRGWYLARLFDGFRMARHFIRALAPSVPAAAVVLAVRLAEPAHRSAAIALGELLLYVAATVAATLVFERHLMREVAGYLRRRTRPLPA